jgi:hypothetical protein
MKIKMVAMYHLRILGRELSTNYSNAFSQTLQANPIQPDIIGLGLFLLKALSRRRMAGYYHSNKQ